MSRESVVIWSCFSKEHKKEMFELHRTNTEMTLTKSKITLKHRKYLTAKSTIRDTIITYRRGSCIEIRSVIRDKKIRQHNSETTVTKSIQCDLQ